MSNLVILECAFCGKAFQVEYARRWQQYCSVACWRRAQNSKYYLNVKNGPDQMPKPKKSKEKSKEKAKEKPKLKATFFKEIIPHVNTGDDFSRQFIGRVMQI
ncbi:MAG: hypothetical protein IKN12_11850 [Selenomonadaceae bacterium]|nr:hypothetical protein [Selenomonadaceae bacterium]